ncbi:MAG TPA: hypothetical protein DDZ51_29590 [Planctomycetaceae bacterium]|nr:hypothetical protein [Planctomycetaceae bacterium]
MNENEIIAALRVLAADITDLGPSPITKDAAMKLLRTEPLKGGVLVQWFNRESDPRRKKILRELIGLTVRAGIVHDAAAIAKATDQLSALVDRIDDTTAEVSQDPDDKLRLSAIDWWNAGASWREVTRKMGRSDAQSKATEMELRRFAEKKSLPIRKGKPGAKRSGGMEQ